MPFEDCVSSVLQCISIEDVQYFIENVPGDGNCFFHCLSVAVFGDFSRSRELRNSVCHTIYNNWQDWHEKVKIFHGPSMTKYNYWGSMIKLNGWASSSEIEATALIFNCRINVWLQCAAGNYILTSFGEPSPQNINLLLSNNHFQLLHQVTDQTETDNAATSCNVEKQMNRTSTNDQTDGTSTNDQTDRTSTNKENDQTRTNDKTDKSRTSDKTDNTTTNDATDKTRTNDKIDKTRTNDETGKSRKYDETDKTWTNDENDRIRTNDETDRTSTNKEKDGTRTNDETDRIRTNDETDRPSTNKENDRTRTNDQTDRANDQTDRTNKSLKKNNRKRKIFGNLLLYSPVSGKIRRRRDCMNETDDLIYDEIQNEEKMDFDYQIGQNGQDIDGGCFEIPNAQVEKTENDLMHTCNALGINYESPVYNETKDQKRLRRKRIRGRIYRYKNKQKSDANPDQENQLKSVCDKYGTYYQPPYEGESICDKKKQAQKNKLSD